ncbi:hypothetical protein WA026_003550 [Henosepilachna vigintioctopunctata]|uniref:Regucalcin n=1 Tax=Henosepilachna vigintioctopunctata TaxID=420089 RepID=A0AAW1TPX3_9CUCU
MAPVIERIVEDVEFGEGPHWDIQTQSLYFVDYLTKSINRYEPATKSHFKARLDDYSSFIIPVEGEPNKFVVSVGKDIAIITWDGVKENIEDIETLVKVDNVDNKNRLNDGKCDVLGRLWTGLMRTDIVEVVPTSPDKNEQNKTKFWELVPNSVNQSESVTGSFYSYGDGTLKKHFDQVDISNGIAWNKDNTRMFFIDSMKNRVDQFDFEVKSGELSNRRVLFSFTKNQIEGMPDGMTIDDDDNLWIAVFRGSKIIKISTSVPENILDTINLPAKQVTSAAWGGKGLDELYVTTGIFDDTSLKPPVNGSLYKITGLKARGLPMYKFRL